MYYCMHCKRDVEVDYSHHGVRCQYCGHRILIKKRPIVIKKLKAE